MTFVPEKPITGGINADEEFWQHLAAGELRITRCSKCAKWIWPAHWRCADCGSWDQEWVQVEPRGTIFSWTRSWAAFDSSPERGEELPYVTLVVMLEEPKVRLIGALAQKDVHDARIGQEVTGAFLPPSAKAKGYPSVEWSLVKSSNKESAS